MKITSGQHEVYDTGTVISYQNEPIIFTINNLKINVNFSNDEKNKKHRIKSQKVSNKELKVNLINFNNSLGTGTTEPLRMGQLNNRELFLNFVVYTLGFESQKIFIYTWYLGVEVNNA
jgi:Domain of unknown function (DUF6864)